MFHLINEAWVDIIARQLKDKKIESALCVYTNNDELQIILKKIKQYDISFHLDFLDGNILSQNLKTCRDYNVNWYLKDFDDILISHDLYDIFTKDYLAKHCRRINKDLK